ncbi:MAG TPA: hypothetical protein VGZ03_07700 [Acidimicrobiales bacterium]|jgi:hypothetical protein|nr:hypothetical protein [Acidimicrobiales bacterium]
MRKLLLVLAVPVVALTLPGLVLPAMATSTTIPFHARIGHIYGMIPPLHVGKKGTLSNSAPASGALHYNGGPVMTTNKVYAIYWQPSGYQFPKGYAKNIDGYFKALQATRGKSNNVYNVATQYYQQLHGGPKQYIQNKTTYGGAVLDTNPLPALDPVNCPDTPVAATNGGTNPPSTTAWCVTDQQIQQEISTVVKKHGWRVSNQTEFFMFTAPNIGTCFPASVSETQNGVTTTVTAPLCSFSYFCAYHSAYFDSTVDTNSQIIYANMPFAQQTNGNPVTCDEGSYPNANASDPEISIISHEHNESITDPFGTGWWDSNSSDSAAGQEIGDMCAWDFGNLYGQAGAQYSQTIDGKHYLMQTEWDNSTNGCPGSDASGNAVPAHPNYDVPSISLTPNSGSAGAPFKITGQFFGEGDHVASVFAQTGASSVRLGSAVANESGRITLRSKVPGRASAGSATVTSTGSTGSATAPFTVPTP